MRLRKPWQLDTGQQGSPPALNDERFRCCGCCHVRTGAMCLGVYNLITQLLCITVLCYAILNASTFMHRMQADTFEPSALPYDSNDDVLAPLESLELLPTPMPVKGGTNSNELVKKAEVIADSDLYRPEHQMYRYTKHDLMWYTSKRIEAGDAHVALAIVFSMFSITALMLYGILKNRPVYLLPFFCFQVFDFVLACLTAVGHYSVMPRIQRSIVENRDFPMSEYISSVDVQWVAVCVVVVYVAILLFKAYCIGIVWACYQYLQLRNSNVVYYNAAEHELSSLLIESEPPAYDEATKAPPRYEDVSSGSA